jgi:hypothetical protein
MKLTRRRFLNLSAATVVAVAAPAFRRSAGGLYAQTALAGDGITNDLPALRTMLAEAEARGRGTIKLPAGRFLLSSEEKKSALEIPANVRIEGMGIDKTELVAAGSITHVVSAPFGWAQLADLTVNGNAEQRPGAIGHAIRANGDNIVIERVRSLNSASYGIGIGQRNYARNAVIRNVEIVNANDDGLDVKNHLNRTSVTIENLAIRGFSRSPSGRGKAALDLRGTCVVRSVDISGLPPNTDGLRFRHGEAGPPTQKEAVNGAGAHGAKVSGVRVRGGSFGGAHHAIAIHARDVHVENIDIAGVAEAIFVTAENAVVRSGSVRNAKRGLHANKFQFGTGSDALLEEIHFAGNEEMRITGVAGLRMKNCRFSNCSQSLERSLRANREIVLENCEFDSGCR